jgi:hypothetical protein
MKKPLMPLSEAIMVGAAMTKPLRGSFYDYDDPAAGACALGCAKLALGQLPRNVSILGVQYPFLNGDCYHPVSGEILVLYEVIENLNDHYKWSRERIAKWVASLGY